MSEEKGGLFERAKYAFKSARRRLKQELHEAVGSSSTTVDEEFQELYQRFQSTELSLTNLIAELERYIVSIKEMSMMQFKLAGDLLFFYDTDAPLRPTAEHYQSVTRTIQQQSTIELVDRLTNEIVKPLQSHLLDFPLVRELVGKRERKRLDLDAYKRKVADCQKKSDTAENRAKVS